MCVCVCVRKRERERERETIITLCIVCHIQYIAHANTQIAHTHIHCIFHTSGFNDFWPLSRELSSVSSFTSNLSSIKINSTRMIPFTHDLCIHL